MTNGKKTIASVLSDAVHYLSGNNGITNPRLECEILLSHLLVWERIRLILQKDDIISEEIYIKFQNLVQRRYKNEPIAYLIGTKEFMSMNFIVKPGILIPRPETEFLVEYVIGSMKHLQNPKILDLCTGSGAIAISIAHYLPDASVVAVDKYDICVETTLENAKRNQVSEQLTVMQHDIFEPFPNDKIFDCIVSNPPYIQKEVLTTLPSDVKNYEPKYALDGGDDGLIFYHRIIELTQNHLKTDGILVLEIGYDQGAELVRLLKESKCFKDIIVTKDYAGLDRMVTAVKRG